jgi:flagellar M-ring protein FliF
MNELFNRLSDYFKPLLERYPPGRRLSLALMFLVIVVACVGLLTWAFKPQYKMLYSDLSLEDSDKIVNMLKEDQVSYRLEQEGRRILVPANKLYDVRLKMAGAGLPSEKGSGWEIFDKTNLGITDFVQKLNFRRGLEGELTRTILQIDNIEAARVHLVMPEESLFRETQKKTMASVTLRMKRGAKLAAGQVEGITYLVSSAVEGLTPENVTVVDSRGYIMSQKTIPDEMMRTTATQWDMQRQVENGMVSKGQELLDKRFGAGRSAIQVTADLDFTRLEQTRELYDADNPAVRSEEITSGNSIGSDTSTSTSEHSITNYELNLTKEHQVNPVGDVRRLNIAVMVDGTYLPNTAGDGKDREFTPLPQQELSEVSETIKSALGFSDDRGDQISVVSVPFQEVSMLEDKELTTSDRWDLIFRYGQKVITLLAVIIMLFLVRSFLRKAQVTGVGRFKPQGQLTGGVGYPGALPAPVAPLDLAAAMSPEARNDVMLQEQIAKFVIEKPEAAAKLVRSWLVEG